MHTHQSSLCSTTNAISSAVGCCARSEHLSAPTSHPDRHPSRKQKTSSRKSPHDDDPMGFILCMQPAEAEFFETLLATRLRVWTRCVENLGDLRAVVDRLESRARLVSFCSDLVVPASIIDQLDGECFNFHSGPPERPGYRPVAFAAAEGASTYGVTFHRMVATIDAGPIYATRRFAVGPQMSEEEIGKLAYGQLLWLAVEVAGWLADAGHPFRQTGETWGASRTTKEDYQRLLHNS